MFMRRSEKKDLKWQDIRRLSEMAAGLALTIIFSCTASAQSSGRRTGQRVNNSDSTTALFEDVYGRFPDGVMPSVSLAHSQTSWEGLNSPTPPNSNFTNGGINVTLGNRKSYELNGNFQNSGATGSTSSQFYYLGFYSRPVAGWEFGGFAFLNRYPGQGPADQYYLDLRVLHLSGGEVKFTESRLQQYYYFSNLLPDAGQTVVSFSPVYSRSRTNPGTGRTIASPFSFSYGLPDGFTLVADANFTQYESSSPLTTLNTTQTLENRNSEFTAGAGLNRMFGNGMLASFNAGYYSQDNETPNYNGGTGAYQTETVQKQTFAVLSIGLDNLFLNTPVSVYDVRRSYYLGHFLHEGEASNSLTVRYATQDINATQTLTQPLGVLSFTRFGADDRFDFGILDMLEVNAEGTLTQHSGRYGSIGLTLHNLNFSGPELSDFDYFFGMINRPGDYTLSVDFSSSRIDDTPSTGVSTTARYGIISNLDVSLNYSYYKYNSSLGMSGNNWGFQIRTNLVGFMRAEGSIAWGRTEYSSISALPTRMKQVQYNLSIDTFF